MIQQSNDVHKQKLDNNDDGEFATPFKQYSAESKDPKARPQEGDLSLTLVEKFTMYQGRVINRSHDAGRLIERTGERIVQFGSAISAIGNWLEHRFDRSSVNRRH